MVRLIYQICGWNVKSTYRIKGIAVPDRRMVLFDLTAAMRVAEGRRLNSSLLLYHTANLFARFRPLIY